MAHITYQLGYYQQINCDITPDNLALVEFVKSLFRGPLAGM